MYGGRVYLGDALLLSGARISLIFLQKEMYNVLVSYVVSGYCCTVFGVGIKDRYDTTAMYKYCALPAPVVRSAFLPHFQSVGGFS